MSSSTPAPMPAPSAAPSAAPGNASKTAQCPSDAGVVMTLPAVAGWLECSGSGDAAELQITEVCCLELEGVIAKPPCNTERVNCLVKANASAPWTDCLKKYGSTAEGGCAATAEGGGESSESKDGSAAPRSAKAGLLALGFAALLATTSF